MKNKMIPTLFFIFTLYSCCKNNNNNNSNRVHFEINQKGRQIILPVTVNDSITANLIFDTGAGCLTLDSTFVADNKLFDKSSPPGFTYQSGSGWSYHGRLAQWYDTSYSVKIGSTNTWHEQVTVVSWRNIFQHNLSDGLFNIPSSDTTNIWELNFEHNYLEIHSSDSFRMPQNCFLTSIKEQNGRRFIVSFPLLVKCVGGDTTTINNTYQIDTGMAWDFAIMPKAKDFNFFHQKEDAVWTEYQNEYHKYQTVNATIFDGFVVDSMRIYTFADSYRLRSEYYVGLNFLKRFNVFFDMKNNQMGLQPIKNYQRVINPDHRRFYFSATQTSDKRIVVTNVADYKTNYYKKAGLQEGDELITINGKPAIDISYQEKSDFHKQDTLWFTVLRNKKQMNIVIPVDKNDKQGD